MATLPRGTLAFLLSDIEGSTRLAAKAGDAFPALLEQHSAVINAAIEKQSGTVVSTEGDSVFAVLPTCRGAISAAIDAQVGLESHDWPEGMAVRVRIGIHVGEAMLGGRDYTGVEISHAARIMAAAWGGQILVSEAVHSMAGESAGEGVTLLDLGAHTLRDISDSEHLYQVVAPGLRVEFPPPRTESAAARTNLPTPLTRFIGRGQELEDLSGMLADARLITLVGPGGTGKTRLEIEAARAALAQFGDGVYFVALDSVRERDLVVPQIAQTLRLVEESARPIFDTLAGYLSAKRMLLVLDNFEQVIDAAPDIAALLAAAPNLTILVSSREPLGVAGETLYSVPPLALPTEPGHPTAAQVAARESVQLFVERARVAKPGFELTDENAPAIAAICRRVDGLPLAIELAAARVGVLAPAQILERLDRRLSLLVGSRRDVTDRQRTLRAAIDWSHDLLSDAEKVGFRRLSVFAGGADLDGAVAVIGGDGTEELDTIDVLQALISRSLIRSVADAATARFVMLETIREYALERLAASGEEETIRERHADFYAAVAEASANVLFVPDRDARLDALDEEMPNIRAALEWSIDRGAFERTSAMAVGLKEFLRTRGHLAESRKLLDRVLATWPQGELRTARADVLGVAGELAAWHTDYNRARELTEEQVALLHQLGDNTRLAYAFSNMAWGNLMERPEVARGLFEQSLANSTESGDKKSRLGALQGLSISQLRLGELEAARSTALAAIEAGDEARDQYTNLFNIMTLGMVELRSGDRAQSARLFADALGRAQSAGASIGIAITLDAIGMLALEDGKADVAAQLALAADRLRQEAGGAPTLELVGDRNIMDQVRDADPAALERARALIGQITTDDAIAAAFSEAAAIESKGA